MTRLSIKKNLELVGDKIEEAYVLHEKTLQELANFHGCSTGSIRQLLISRNVPLRSRGRRKNQRRISFDGAIAISPQENI